MKKIDLIAAGYEWVCPSCKEHNEEICGSETVTCGNSECEEIFKVDNIDHAI